MEKKIAPDKWEFTHATNKRRAWQAPEGSGVPVGTEYSSIQPCRNDKLLVSVLNAT